MRLVLGIIAGYVVVAVATLAFFTLSGQDPHAAQSTAYVMVSMVVGIVAAAAGGYLAVLIAGQSTLRAGIGVAVLIAAGAMISIVMSAETDSRWSQLTAIVLMAPAAVIGGWLRQRQIVPPARPSP